MSAAPQAPAVTEMKLGMRPLRRVSLVFLVFGACGTPWSLVGGNYRGVSYVYFGTGLLGLIFFVFSITYLAGYLARQRRLIQDGVAAVAHLEINPAAWSTIPPAPEGQGYLYVIQFSSGTVKVGRAVWPATRLGDHRRYGWAFGVVIVRAWVSTAHEGYEATEAQLIEYAAKTATGDRARREFFHGADFDGLVTYATGLAGGSLAAVPAL